MSYCKYFLLTSIVKFKIQFTKLFDFIPKKKGIWPSVHCLVLFTFCTNYKTSSDREGLQAIGPTGRGLKHVFVPIPAFLAPWKPSKTLISLLVI